MRLLVVLFAYLSISLATPLHKSKDETDVGLTAPQMIQKHGYPVEIHYVTTEDGYILEVHRIPSGINQELKATKGSLLLMHGLISSSADFVNMGPDRSLAYILADQGYDVWLGNARGNIYGRNHTTLNPNQDKSEFWNFSWHEIGNNDLPAIIDYILQTTGETSLYYVGHSQGTTSFLVLASSRPEYNAKIKIASLMATAAHMEHTVGLLVELSNYLQSIQDLFNSMQIFEIPLLDLVRLFGQNNCNKTEFQDLCIAFLNVIGGGDDSAQLDPSLLAVIATNAPASASLKQGYHYLQLIKSGGFRQYDYGVDENLVHYGSEIPPDYDLSLITTPVAFYSGANDGVVNYEDVQIIVESIPNAVENYLVPYELFNHVDFVFAKDVVDLLYNKLISDLEQY